MSSSSDLGEFDVSTFIHVLYLCYQEADKDSASSSVGFSRDDTSRHQQGVMNAGQTPLHQHMHNAKTQSDHKAGVGTRDGVLYGWLIILNKTSSS